VVVLSLSRSGSSLVARVLHQVLGVDFGDTIEHLPPNRFNPDGYFENLKIVDLNEEVLEAAGAGVFDLPAREFLADAARFEPYSKRLALLLEDLAASGRTFGVKDPRLALTLPLFRQVWSPVLAVVVYRNPLSAALSIVEQNGIAHAHALDLWYEYYYRILAYSAGLPRHIVSFERLLEAPGEVGVGLAGFVGRGTPPSEIGARMAAIVDVRKVHHGLQPEDSQLSPLLDPKAKILYAFLEEAVRGGGQPDPARLGSLVAALDYHDTHHRPGASRPSTTFLREQADRLRASAASREAELQQREQAVAARESAVASQAAALQALAAERDELVRRARELETATEELRARGVDQESRARAEIATLQARLDALYSSTSWRVTEPLRRLTVAARRRRSGP
jgi:hypothetical protein